MKNIKLLALTLLSASVFIISCSKSAPVGPTGATGTKGATGAVGSDSVLYSGPITLQMTLTTDSNGWNYYADTISASAVTAQIVQQGLIAGFLYFPTEFGDTTWVSVDNYYWFDVNQYVSVGKITLNCDWYENGNGDLSGFKYRYVILPGTLETSSTNGQTQTITAAQLKKMDYKTLTSTLESAKSANGSTSTQLRSN